MGFRFRKSKRFGPFRINLSKSGVGFSAGVKGFRITKKATGGLRTTVSVPGTGLSYVKDFNPEENHISSGKDVHSMEEPNTDELPTSQVPGENTPPENQTGKSKTVEFVLCLLLGWLGVHKFYTRKIGIGILYLVTFGLFTVGWFGDTVLLLISLVTKGKAHFGHGSKKAEAIVKVGVYGIIAVIAFCLFVGGCSDTPSEPTEPTDPDKSIMATMNTSGTTAPAATEPTIPTEEHTVPETLPPTVPTATEPPVTTTPPATEPPATTVPPATEPPATTAPPATEPPATTAPPATEPPATTAPPATEPPATTAPPATEPPATTAPPATEPPVTEATSIAFLSWPQTASRNEDVTVRIHGAPNTEYSITVRYKSGPSTAKGLETKTSDADGYVSWTWHVGGNTSSGTFTITVSGGGQSETVNFTVIE